MVFLLGPVMSDGRKMNFSLQKSSMISAVSLSVPGGQLEACRFRKWIFFYYLFFLLKILFVAAVWCAYFFFGAKKLQWY